MIATALLPDWAILLIAYVPLGTFVLLLPWWVRGSARRAIAKERKQAWARARKRTDEALASGWQPMTMRPLNDEDPA